MENLFRFPDEGNQYVIPQQPPTLPHLRFSVSDTSNHRRPGAHRSGVKRARGRTQSRRRVRLKHGALKADEVPRPHKLPSTLQNQQLTSNHPSRTPSRSSPSFAKDAVKASINTGTRRLEAKTQTHEGKKKRLFLSRTIAAFSTAAFPADYSNH